MVDDPGSVFARACKDTDPPAKLLGKKVTFVFFQVIGAKIVNETFGEDWRIVTDHSSLLKQLNTLPDFRFNLTQSSQQAELLASFLNVPQQSIFTNLSSLFIAMDSYNPFGYIMIRKYPEIWKAEENKDYASLPILR